MPFSFSVRDVSSLRQSSRSQTISSISFSKERADQRVSYIAASRAELSMVVCIVVESRDREEVAVWVCCSHSHASCTMHHHHHHHHISSVRRSSHYFRSRVNHEENRDRGPPTKPRTAKTGNKYSTIPYLARSSVWHRTCDTYYLTISQPRGIFRNHYSV